MRVSGDPDGITKFLTVIARPTAEGFLEYENPDGTLMLAHPTRTWDIDGQLVMEHAARTGLDMNAALEDLYGPVTFRLDDSPQEVS